MADYPMLYSAPMVRGLIREAHAPFTGKRQTRRISKDQPPVGVSINRKTIRPIGQEPFHAFERRTKFGNFGGEVPVKIKRGDRIWVREEFSGPGWFRPKIDPPATWPVGCDVWYWADGNPPYGDWTKPKRSMHMPRWMSRLTLTVTDVRVERLQDISEEDARAEGIERIGAEYIAQGSTSWDQGPNFYTVDIGGANINDVTAKDVYRRLWEWINGEESWPSNPWVVAYTFTVVKQNIDQIARAA